MSAFKTLVTSLCAGAVLAAAPAMAAAPIDGNVLYTLKSHPNGGISPPDYGLRLDGLDGDASHEFTFDFSHPWSNMTMLWDGNGTIANPNGKLTISGTTYGGEVDVPNDAYFSTSLFKVDFTYDDAFVSGNQILANTGTGSITDINGTFISTLSLDAYAGNHSAAFYMGEGHRNGPGVSGWGWLNHGAFPSHVYASDWLFSVDKGVPVPETSTYLLMGSFLLGGALLRRRNQVKA